MEIRTYTNAASGKKFTGLYMEDNLGEFISETPDRRESRIAAHIPITLHSDATSFTIESGQTTRATEPDRIAFIEANPKTYAGNKEWIS